MINALHFSKRSQNCAIKLLSLLLPAILFSIQPNMVDKASAQRSNVKAEYGAWQLKCGKAPGSKLEKCALVQSVTAENRPNVGLTVIFLKSIDGKQRMLRIIAPLGVLIPTGLGLKIDGVDIGNVKFLKCARIGCIAEAAVDNKLISKLKSGKQAVFVIFPTPEQAFGIPSRLKGFKEGLARLR